MNSRLSLGFILSRQLRLGILFCSLFLNLYLAAQPSNNPIVVRVAVVDEMDWVDEIDALGTLKSKESVDLTATVTELVTNILFKDGDIVKEGDVIFEMNASEEKAQIKEQMALLLEAEKQLERRQKLAETGALPQSELDLAIAERDTIAARIEAIQSRVDSRLIRAPFDGKLGLIDISRGMLAQPGTVLAQLDDTSSMKLDFTVPSRFLSTIQEGLRIEAKTSAYQDRIFRAKIDTVSNRIDPMSRSIEARALIENENQLLRSGMLMTINLKKSPRRALVIPEEALMNKGNDHFVFLVDRNKPEKVNLKKVVIGARKKGSVEILEGLSNADKVVTHGIVKLRDGVSVQYDQ